MSTDIDQAPDAVDQIRTGWIKADGTASVSYSALTSHRSCPQAWLYKYQLKLSRDQTQASPERDFGTWYGAIRSAEALERGRQKGSLRGKPGSFRIMDDLPKADAATLTVRDVRLLARKWWRGQTMDTKDLWIEKLGEDLPSRLDAVYVRWLDEYGKLAQKESPVGVEIFWERQLPKPQAITADDAALMDETHVSILGFIDEIYLDDERGIYVARDNKTSKALQAATTVDDMMDSQLQLYAWGAGPLMQQLGVDRLRAVAYDRIRSIKPSSPAVTAAGKLSKSVSDYDLRTYLEWSRQDTRPTDDAIEHLLTDDDGNWDVEKYEELKAYRDSLVPGPFWGKLGDHVKTGKNAGNAKYGTYEAEDTEIARLQTPVHKARFLQRTLTPISQNVVQGHLRAAADTALEILRTERRSASTGEAARNLTRRGCQMCDFAALCRAQMVGGAGGEYELAEFGLKAKDGRAHA